MPGFKTYESIMFLLESTTQAEETQGVEAKIVVLRRKENDIVTSISWIWIKHKLEEFLTGDAFEELNQNLRIKDQEIKLANLKQ